MASGDTREANRVATPRSEKLARRKASSYQRLSDDELLDLEKLSDLAVSKKWYSWSWDFESRRLKVTQPY